jgi:cbb3-type cytochrome oxidase subunit 3
VASKKQRRRREKLQRHEYEYVLETEEGEQVLEGPRAPEAAPRNGKAGKAAKASSGPVDRRGRPVPKPSLRRVLRRTAVFAPLMAIVIYLLVRNEAENVLTTVVFQTALLVLFFMPFSYVVDAFMYRMSLRRQERDRAARGER